MSSLIGNAGKSGGHGEVLSPEATIIKSKIDTLRADLMKEKETLARNVGKAGDFNNEQYKNALDKITALEKEIDALQASQEVKNELAQLLGELRNKVKFDGIDVQKMGEITNKEFLSLPHEKRLPYITTGRVEYDKVANGTQKVIEFTFSFNGKINKDLYYKTTAGQVFPSEVSEVSIGGEIYFRTGLAGEFFTKNNKRLVIHDGTKVEVSKLRTKEEMTAIQQENANKVQAYLEQNPQANKEILKEAINRNIDPKFALLAFEDAYNAAKDGDKRYLLEDMVTEFDRIRDYISGDTIQDDKYNIELGATLIRKFNPNNWKELAQEYGYRVADIEVASSKILDYEERAKKVRDFDVSDKKDFMQKSKAVALEIEKSYGIPWQVIVGQAALESGWGESGLSEKYNNFFGIKASRGEKSVSMGTTEVYNGVSQRENANFVVFDTMQDSFIGHAEFLIRNPRYREAFKYAQNIEPRPWYYPKDYVGYDPIKFLEEVKQGGYATDPDYVAKVSSVISKFTA